MKKFIVVLFVLVSLLMLTTAVSANGLPEGWCTTYSPVFEAIVYVPCPGYEHLDVFDCAGYLDCRWFANICIDGTSYAVGVYFDPEFVDDDFRHENPWYPVGGCMLAGCRLVAQEQITLYTNGIPAKYTELWYVGECTAVSWGNAYGNHFSSRLWFNEANDFQWVKVNGTWVKHCFTKNPTYRGPYDATLIGNGPGGYWTIVVP